MFQSKLHLILVAAMLVLAAVQAAAPQTPDTPEVPTGARLVVFEGFLRAT